MNFLVAGSAAVEYFPVPCCILHATVSHCIKKNHRERGNIEQFVVICLVGPCVGGLSFLLVVLSCFLTENNSPDNHDCQLISSTSMGR